MKAAIIAGTGSRQAYKKFGLSIAINNKYAPHPRHEEINYRGTDFVPRR